MKASDSFPAVDAMELTDPCPEKSSLHCPKQPAKVAAPALEKRISTSSEDVTEFAFTHAAGEMEDIEGLDFGDIPFHEELCQL